MPKFIPPDTPNFRRCNPLESGNPILIRRSYSHFFSRQVRRSKRFHPMKVLGNERCHSGWHNGAFRPKGRIRDGPLWVFPAVKTVRYSTNKTGHVRLMAAALKLNTGLNITVHGLRRTFITTARRLKIFEDADRLTNHVDSTISGRHYDATDVEDLRQPLQTIANELERLMVEGMRAKILRLQ